MIFIMSNKPKKIFHFLFFSIILELLRCRIVHGQYSSESANTNRTIRCLERERIALLKFKADLVDEYNRLSSWGIEENKRDCCLWKGVHCHKKNNHVTQLNLKGSLTEYGYLDDPLQGRINPSLLELQHLRYLDLSFNDFNLSRIPNFIGSLSQLRYLNLSSANFGGMIPHQLGNLSKLIYLDLSFNDFNNSRIPNFIGSLSELRYLNLSKASFGGPIPHQLGNLSKLIYLDLSDSDTDSQLDWVSQLPSLEYLYLNGADLSLATNWLHVLSKLTLIKEVYMSNCLLQADILPNSFVPSINSSSHLAILDLSANGLSLPLSKLLSFSNFSSTITSMDLSYNMIEGGISNSLWNLSSLIYMNMGCNKLSGPFPSLMTNFSGSFPNILRFPYLKELDLSGNRLTGSIPEICLPNLEYFDLSRNNFSGPVPDLSLCSSKLQSLRLASNHLEGIITESSLFNLSQLRGLDLSFNSKLKVKCNPYWIPPFQLEYMKLAQCQIGPQFPKWIRNQKELFYLDISDAQISDTIPSWFGTLASQLRYLYASNNQMFGFFPNLFVSNSRPASLSYPSVLDISRNSFSGSMKFLCHGPQWKAIDLSDNQLSEQLHDCFENFPSLEYLNLANNNFSGKIPNSLGSLQKLTWLYLQNNSFTGVMPTFMSKRTNLRMVDLAENRLTGKIPTWLGDSFSYVKYLKLSSNRFFGSIPSSICGLENIRVLDLSSNSISGAIPKCIYNLTSMTKEQNNQDENFVPVYDIWGFDQPNYVIAGFEVFPDAYFMWKGNVVNYQNRWDLVRLIDLSNNVLVGEIPKEIVKLVGLISLNLSINNLTGAIPENIGEMKSLDSLDLSRNQLSGGIPNSLSYLNQLGTFNLSYNNLSGKIPQMSHMLTFDELTYLGNPYLCGKPLKIPCPEDVETHQDRNFNGESSSDHEEEDKFITQGFFISIGVGFFVGFWGVFGPVLFNKKTRFALCKAFDGCFDCVYVRIEISKNRFRRYFQKE